MPFLNGGGQLEKSNQYSDRQLEKSNQYSDRQLEISKQYCDEQLEISKQYCDNKLSTKLSKYFVSGISIDDIFNKLYSLGVDLQWEKVAVQTIYNNINSYLNRLTPIPTGGPIIHVIVMGQWNLYSILMYNYACDKLLMVGNIYGTWTARLMI